MTSPLAASEGSASGRGSKAWLASCSAFAVALLLLGAMLWTLFEKNLVSTLTQQGWTRELYGISAALTKLRFGVGGSAIDQRLFATLARSGLTDAAGSSVERAVSRQSSRCAAAAVRIGAGANHRSAAAEVCQCQGRIHRPHRLFRRRHRARHICLPGVPDFRGEYPGADLPLLRHRDGIVGALRYWSLAQRRRHGRRRRGDAGALCGRLRRLREFPRFQRLFPRRRHRCEGSAIPRHHRRRSFAARDCHVDAAVVTGSVRSTILSSPCRRRFSLLPCKSGRRSFGPYWRCRPSG